MGGGQQAPPPMIIPAPEPIIIQQPLPPPAPLSPEVNPQLISQQADIFKDRFMHDIVQPGMMGLREQEQARIPSEYGQAGFFPEEQQKYLQGATSQLQDLYVQPSLAAELAAQQSMFQAGFSTLESLRDSAQRRAAMEEAQYRSYAQAAPQFAMGFGDVFGQLGKSLANKPYNIPGGETAPSSPSGGFDQPWATA